MIRFAFALAASFAAALIQLTNPAQAGGFRFCVECGGGLQYYGDKAYMRGPDLTIGGHAEWSSRRYSRERPRRDISRREMHETVKAKRAAIARAKAAHEAAQARARVHAALAAKRAAEKAAAAKAARARAKTIAIAKAAPTEKPASSEPKAAPRTEAQVVSASSSDAAAAAVAQAEQKAKAEALVQQLLGKRDAEGSITAAR